MATQFTISGVVLQDGTNRPIQGANVRMIVGTNEFITSTNANGYYQFQPVDEPLLADNQATYSLSLFSYMAGDKDQKSKPVLVRMVKGNKSANVEILIEDRGPISELGGWIFLVALIVLLSLLSWKYYEWHAPDDKNQGSADHQLVGLLTENLVDRIQTDSAKISNFKLTNNLFTEADSLFLMAETDKIARCAKDLVEKAQLDTSYNTLISSNLELVPHAITNGNKEEVLTSLRSAKNYISKIPTLKPSWFWKSKPGIYWEIILWALFATLIRLIGNTGYYLSRNIFYLNSIPNKLKLIFTVPLIAFLIGQIISFFKISITLGDAGLILDFTNPIVAVILAALIGLAPWKAWEFMYGLSDQLFQSLKNWLGLAKSGDTPSEGENGAIGTPNTGSNSTPPDIPPTDPPEPNPDEDKPADPELEVPEDAAIKPADEAESSQNANDTVADNGEDSNADGDAEGENKKP
ncbi:MAG: hypothetical protein AAGA77_15310 [Bacteroidota bacterium]